VAVRLSLLAGFAGLLDMLHVGCLYSPCLRILYARTYLFISGYFDVLAVCAYGCMRVCLVQCYCCVCFCVCVCVCACLVILGYIRIIDIVESRSTTWFVWVFRFESSRLVNAIWTDIISTFSEICFGGKNGCY